MENALIIFVRNTEKGKVKTRLAKDIGDDKTIKVYKYLLQYTRNVAISCNCSHFVFYSSYVHVNDMFDDDLFTKFLQEGDSLGERMMNAFKKVFELGCKRVCIIGSDCYDLTSATIEKAFQELIAADMVIGPSRDGGYYLLGLKDVYADLFEGKDWGDSSVFDDTIATAKSLQLNYIELDELNDIDTVDDLLETDILTNIEEDIEP